MHLVYTYEYMSSRIFVIFQIYLGYRIRHRQLFAWPLTRYQLERLVPRYARSFSWEYVEVSFIRRKPYSYTHPSDSIEFPFGLLIFFLVGM